MKELGNTVLVVEHDEQMMRSSDWVVDMGPGAGEHGGEVSRKAPPRRFSATRRSITGQFPLGKRQIAIPERRGQDATGSR